MVDTAVVVETVTYYYAVFSRDDAHNWNDVVLFKSSADTGIARDLTPPAIVDVQMDTGTDMILVTMATDEPTTLRIDYGITSGYGSSYMDTVLSTTHSGELPDLDPDTEYHFMLTCTDAYGNEFITTDTSFTTPVSSGGGGGGGGCFIATAAYGSYEEPYVKILRDFRDDYLLTNRPGTWFVEQYYTHSPRYADWLRGHELARSVVRILLLPLIGLAWFLTKASSINQILILCIFAVFTIASLRSTVVRRRTAE